MSINANELRIRVKEVLESEHFQFSDNGDLILPSLEKETIRLLHKPSTDFELEKAQEWIKRKIPKYIHFFANGADIKPEIIQPILVKVEETWQKDLFRLARYYWSLPYSQGFGRRLRYLVLDSSNEKLIGIFGLQSPPINFPVRDKMIRYPEGKKTEIVNQTMDIFTLGALPPYNELLGGKLISLAAVANEVREDYKLTYSESITQIEHRIIPANLIALTTTSAFGRSSIYNRLKYNEQLIAESIGYTNGYGNFHMQSLYPLFKEYLNEKNISTKGGFGNGPKRSWQIIRRALDDIGISNDLLKHGVRREAFLFKLINNYEDYVEGKSDSPDYKNFPFDNLAMFWKNRWLLPRASRVTSWCTWNNDQIKNFLLLERNGD